MIDALAKRIWERDEFQAQFRSLVVEHLRHSLSLETTLLSEIETLEVRKLVQSAVHLASSPVTEHRDAAYRIGVCCWDLFSEFDSLRELLHLIFGRLGNFPAITYLRSTTEEDDPVRIPLGLYSEIESHRNDNSVQVTPAYRVCFTDFQRRLWDALTSNNSVAVTAPTSAGKSFALQNYLISRINSGQLRLALYIVPTRALINQVSASLRSLIQRHSYVQASVSTVPLPPEQLSSDCLLYVLTQERLQILLNSGSAAFDVVIADEAQGVADGDRGIILQTALEDVIALNPRVQILFGSPRTSNLEIFRETFRVERLNQITEGESPVAQNLILVNTVSRQPRVGDLQAYAPEKLTPIGRYALSRTPQGQSDTFALITYLLAEGNSSLLYASEPQQCEKVAQSLAAILTPDSPEQPDTDSAELADFADFLSEYIHPEYPLARTIRSGVGVHYGYMPAIVRSTIEELFDEGIVRYLVCTSTLLQGVNLPAKNLFLFKPTKGRNPISNEMEAISSTDFWNLAGRAGRLGREFEGNIFLIHPSKWKENPLQGEKEQVVTPSLNRIIVDRTEHLLNYIADDQHRSGQDRSLENAFVKLVNEARRGMLESTLDRLFSGESPDRRQLLTQAVSQVVDRLEIPVWITQQNSSISVLRQQGLFEYLSAKIADNGPDDYIPPHPLRPWNEAHPLLGRMFGRFHRVFEMGPSGSGLPFWDATLALHWMRGDSFRTLIDLAIEDNTRRGNSASTARVIRRLLERIEKDLRFRYVKYTRCYIDILTEIFRSLGLDQELTRIPNLPLFLELGASSETMISLIGLGLSRTTAMVIADLAPSRHLERGATESWFQSVNWEQVRIPLVCLREIRQLLQG